MDLTGRGGQFGLDIIGIAEREDGDPQAIAIRDLTMSDAFPSKPAYSQRSNSTNQLKLIPLLL
ncbi:MAG: hypothetical protein KF893_17030, partial [Caldilineaceae bacterium]|nr:hypothetical protein [Caldilineaceae bacterium]